MGASGTFLCSLSCASAQERVSSGTFFGILSFGIIVDKSVPDKCCYSIVLTAARCEPE